MCRVIGEQKDTPKITLAKNKQKNCYKMPRSGGLEMRFLLNIAESIGSPYMQREESL